MRFAITAIAVTLLSFPVFAQPQCAPLAQLRLSLEDVYGETVMDVFEPAGGGALIFFGNNETGTWTELRVRPGSPIACVTNMGQRFERFEFKVSAPADPSA